MGLRRSRDSDGLERGERVLATASGPDGDTVATTFRLVPAGDLASGVEWNMIERASWDGEESVLDVVEVPDASGRKRRRRLAISRPGRLVDVVREQVTASVVISRHITVEGRRGVWVTGRRSRHGDIAWSVVLDSGIDIADASTRARVDAAVVLVRGEVE